MSDTNPTKFWIEDPCILFTDLVFFPTTEMTREQKLNALTRLAIIISVIMFTFDYPNWYIFLLISILFIIVIQYSSKAKDVKKTEEHFSVVPTRVGDDFLQTIVTPTYSEEVRVPPPSYDQFNDTTILDIPFEEPVRSQAYPYGQYLTKTNLLPSDEYYVHMNGSGGARSAREFANSTFTRNEIAGRENQTRILKKLLARRFRHNSLNDSYSPFHSY